MLRLIFLVLLSLQARVSSNTKYSSLEGDPTHQALMQPTVRTEILPTLKQLILSNSRTIPRSVWIPKCIKPSILPDTLQRMKEINLNWTFHLQDCNEQEAFMNTYYANTSILAAFNLINPILRSPKTDIYRFSILYAMGGMYLDYDAHVMIPLDSFILHNDSLLLSQQRGQAYSNLYNESHYLSTTGMISTDVFPLFNTLVQWMIVSKPRNPIILRALENLVDLIKREYIKSSAIIYQMKDDLLMQIFLTVGPMMFTATCREIFLSDNITTIEEKASVRFYKKAEFKEIGAVHQMTRTYATVIKTRANNNEKTVFLTKYAD